VLLAVLGDDVTRTRLLLTLRASYLERTRVRVQSEDPRRPASSESVPPNAVNGSPYIEAGAQESRNVRALRRGRAFA
jgi:hypothetical protein